MEMRFIRNRIIDMHTVGHLFDPDFCLFLIYSLRRFWAFFFASFTLSRYYFTFGFFYPSFSFFSWGSSSPKNLCASPTTSSSIRIYSKVVILNFTEFFLLLAVGFWCSISIFIDLVWVTEMLSLSSSKLLLSFYPMF